MKRVNFFMSLVIFGSILIVLAVGIMTFPTPTTTAANQDKQDPNKPIASEGSKRTPESIAADNYTPREQEAADLLDTGYDVPTKSSESEQDTARELTLMHRVFNDDYNGPFDSEEAISITSISWPEWEHVYFEREFYAHEIEKYVSQDWKLGRWFFWKAHISVTVPNEMDRGGPIQFRVVYPLVDWRDDLIIEVRKTWPEGAECSIGSGSHIDKVTTVSVTQGAYHTPRYTYPAAMGISLVAFVIIIAIICAVGWLLFTISKLIIRLIAGILFPQQQNNVWVQRIAGFMYGAIVLVCISILNLILS